jgi:hypothetical protein
MKIGNNSVFFHFQEFRHLSGQDRDKCYETVGLVCSEASQMLYKILIKLTNINLIQSTIYIYIYMFVPYRNPNCLTNLGEIWHRYIF